MALLSGAAAAGGAAAGDVGAGGVAAANEGGVGTGEVQLEISRGAGPATWVGPEDMRDAGSRGRSEPGAPPPASPCWIVGMGADGGDGRMSGGLNGAKRGTGDSSSSAASRSSGSACGSVQEDGAVGDAGGTRGGTGAPRPAVEKGIDEKDGVPWRGRASPVCGLGIAIPPDGVGPGDMLGGADGSRCSPAAGRGGRIGRPPGGSSGVHLLDCGTGHDPGDSGGAARRPRGGIAGIPYAGVCVLGIGGGTSRRGRVTSSTGSAGSAGAAAAGAAAVRAAGGMTGMDPVGAKRSSCA